MPERIEITCPCGTILVKDQSDTRGEIPCPACGRYNILPAGDGERGGASFALDPATTGADTTAIRPPPPSTPEITAGTVVGPYEVEGLIGEGGMGRVYTAIDVSLQRRVALKVLSGDLRGKEDFVARFRREARSVARLNHPNIVQIYYTGTHAGLPYYAMELVVGENLATVLKREGPLDAERGTDLMLQAARGLAAAAAEGIIHRDIKPSNMVLDEEGVLKITDFGLAKTMSSQTELTMTGTIVGTPFYMSPEQGEGRPLDQRADIYSLGASFYHLFAGVPPFDANSPVSIILKHINEDLQALQERNRKVPAALAAIIGRMMAKHTDDRYASYEELAVDIESAQGGAKPGAMNWKEPNRRGARTAAARDNRKIKSYVIEDIEGDEFPEEIRLARTGMFRRFFAFVVDFAFLSTIYRVADEVFQDFDWGGIFLLFSFVYFFVADSLGGVTLGKAFFRCRVGRRDGEDLGLALGLFRNLLFFGLLFGLSSIPFFLTWDVFHLALADVLDNPGVACRICMIWLFVDVGYFVFSGSRRMLHDMMTAAHFFTRVRIPKEEDRDDTTSLPRRPKDPLLAAVLSTICPGLGQFYIGDAMKGILIFLTCFLVIPWVIGIFHAYFKAVRINRELGMTV